MGSESGSRDDLQDGRALHDKALPKTASLASTQARYRAHSAQRLGAMNVYLFDDAVATIKALADEIQSLSDAKREVHIALSGGSTPKHLFNFIVNSGYRDSIVWEHLHFWWGDERCVASDDPESNFGEADRLLFQEVNIPRENIHPISGSLSSQQACEQFEQAMKERLAWVNGHPFFDWILLGVGEDGHTASLFPDEAPYVSSSVDHAGHVEPSAVLASHPLSGQVRVSLSVPAIENARRVTYLALGSGKQDVLPKVTRDAESNQHLPAASIRSKEGITECFTDMAGGKGLGLV